jgi:hypothetical protein
VLRNQGKFNAKLPVDKAAPADAAGGAHRCPCAVGAPALRRGPHRDRHHRPAHARGAADHLQLEPAEVDYLLLLDKLYILSYALVVLTLAVIVRNSWVDATGQRGQGRDSPASTSWPPR